LENDHIYNVISYEDMKGMGSNNSKLYYTGISLLSVLLVTGLGFGIFSQSQNNVDSISDFRGGFIQFASATHVNPTAFSSVVSTVEGFDLNITLTGSETHGDFSLGFFPNDTAMMNAGEGMLGANPSLDDATPPLTFVVVTYFVPNVNYNGLTSFTFNVTDDGGFTFSDPATVEIMVNATNDAPVIEGLPETIPVAILEDEVFSFSNLLVSDVDGDIEAEVTLTASSTVTLVTTSNLSFTVGDGIDDSAMTFNGSLTNLSLALDELSFAPTKDVHGVGAGTLQIDVSDQGNTGTGVLIPLFANATITFDITSVNDAPVNTVPGTQVMNEGAVLEFGTTNTNQISIADVDIDEGTGIANVTLVATSSLSLSTIDGLNSTFIASISLIISSNCDTSSSIAINIFIGRSVYHTI